MQTQINKNFIGGVKNILTPLISFDAIFDLDFGLINLVYDQYLDKKVFNENSFVGNPVDIIYKLYHNKSINPLYIIANENISRDLLDNYFSEFIETKMNDICEMSITTNIIDMIDLFNNSQEIRASIVYYHPDQLKFLENEPKLKSNPKIYFEDLKNMNKYNQLWVKSVHELEKFKRFLQVKSIYVSTIDSNFNSDNNLIETDMVNDILKHGNTIGIFDIYKEDIFK